MNDEACLYVVMICPRESHDRILRDLVTPLVREIRPRRELDSLFFVRYDDPEWQLRFRVLGRPDWVEGPVRRRLEAGLAPLIAEGTIRGVEFGRYAREWERYGGEMGMRLAEQVFTLDSVACLELLEAEEKGRLEGSRREWSLVFTERFLDLFGFDAPRRLEFYRSGHEWAFRDGSFREEDVPRLERQYQAVRVGLGALLAPPREPGGGASPGGVDPERIARAHLDAVRPVVREILARHAEGKIVQDLTYLAWSYAHLHCNRLGIELVPEAILRYIMFRWYQEKTA